MLRAEQLVTLNKHDLLHNLQPKDVDTSTHCFSLSLVALISMHSPTPCTTIILTDSVFENLLIMLLKIIVIDNNKLGMSWGLNKNYLMKNFGV